VNRTVILPTLNELDGVCALAPNLQRLPADEVLAVDGGSTDGTLDRLKSLGIAIYQQRRPGRGAGIREGVAATQGELIVVFSPDGNEDPADIPVLFELLENGCDMAVGSRFLPGARNEEDEARLPLRKWVNLGFTRLANALWAPPGVHVSDAINGLRGFRREAFLQMSPQSERFTIEYEMTQRALRLGLRIDEVPTREGARIGGESKAPSIRTGVEFCRFVVGQIVKGA
jgi:glycosyltransferase involved in cell wall biosynthesis